MTQPQLSPDYRARVAAEIAARYGVMCSPEAVQVVEPGRMSTPEYIWCGKANALVQKQPEPHSAALRRSIDVKWKSLARANRLAAAKRREHGELSTDQPARRISGRGDAMIKAAAKREASVREFIGDGKTAKEVAGFMGISVHSARGYCRLKGIDLKPEPRREYLPRPLAQEDIERYSEMCQTMTVTQIAAATGVKRDTVKKRLGRLGLQAQPFRRERKPKAPRVRVSNRAIYDQRQADMAQRRARVAELYHAGKSDAEIAEALGERRGLVRRDRLHLGLQRARAVPVDDLAGSKLSAIKRRITERDEQIRQGRADGLTIQQIADRCECGVATVTNALMRMGLTVKGGLKGHVGDPALVARVQAMIAVGIPRRAIAEKCGIASSTVQRIADRLKQIAASQQEAA